MEKEKKMSHKFDINFIIYFQCIILSLATGRQTEVALLKAELLCS